MTGPASPAHDSTSTQPLLLPSQQAGTSTCAAVVLDSFARAAEGDSFGPWEYSALKGVATRREGEDDDGLERLAEEMGMLLTPETEKSGCDWTTPEQEAGGECCCLSGEPEAKTVRLVPGYDEDGNVGRTVADLHFDILRRAKVIPETANPSSFANTLQLSSTLSALLSQHRLTLLPHHDQLSTRLAFEYTYQLSRLRSLQSPFSSSRHSKRPRIPARPDFEHHYAALERQGAIVRPFWDWTCGRGVFERCDERGEMRKYRMNSVDEAFEGGAEEEGMEEVDAAKDAPPIPWYRLPCSMNLLLYAMADRMQQNAPAPEAVQEETEALSTGTRLLLSFWHLTPSTPTSSISSLLSRTKSYLTTHLDSSSFPRFIERVDATMRAEEFLTPVPGWCIQEGVGWEKIERARRRAVGEGGAPARIDRIAALQKEQEDPATESNTSTPGSQTPSTSTSAAAPTAEQKERQEFVRAWMAQLAS